MKPGKKAQNSSARSQLSAEANRQDKLGFLESAMQWHDSDIENG
ncbi:hypothetical protein [Phormidium sp. CCY1219]|nr:hypothetical protein [Phormidium sp. CCY1219]